MKDQFKILVAAMFAATLLAGCEADGGSSGVDVVANPNPQSRNVDQDGDGVADLLDNCPDMANAMQEDADGDGVGDVCDEDRDGDGVDNVSDNCPLVANADQADTDTDGLGDLCDDDLDTDKDGVDDGIDNCPFEFNPEQGDVDNDGQGDACDADGDGDGVDNGSDNCPFTANADQADEDLNGVGDACEGDVDGDGVADGEDNCLNMPNADQADADLDGLGDVCDDDRDGDAHDNDGDNCPLIANGDQADSNGNGVGDLCDENGGSTPVGDTDNDGHDDNVDNCPNVPNGNQKDSDGDGKGDVCDSDGFTCGAGTAFTPLTNATHDADGDGLGGFGEFGICLACSVDNPEYIIDNNVATFAELKIGAALVKGGAYVSADAKDENQNVNASRLGFVVSDPASPLFNIEVLGDFITIRFYDNGSMVKKQVVDGSLIDVDLLGIGANTSQRFLVTSAPENFDSVSLTYAGAFNVNKSFRVHDVCYEPKP
ncbi:thrombospondin type 3 repeat-containing protein [Alcanivorax sp. S6407]|uniref:thrombospondin type 3 repeat-containing protein n=1 Tax=Alcanivorax sp. S6407 TaxID=2926424 RepID=UPI001FF30B6D|nr:thrombospondin type 3 repeat-containing protein [Alcanivorax sp. S6407]MCK0154351.1 thrombospondin type 3 repeat-containing protein [Alcanivorax sp. S6407]